MEYTGERCIPGMAGMEMLELEHRARYALAARFVKGKRVLDLGSGSGYGVASLAETASFVLGVDISEEAVEYAQNRYAPENSTYAVADLCADDLVDQIRSIAAEPFDCITCFEVIEHVTAPVKILRAVRELLTTDGVFVVSTPNTDSPSVIDGMSAYHVTEYSRQEFVQCLGASFKRVTLAGQQVHLMSSIGFKPDSSVSLDEWRTLEETMPKYYVALCSNGQEELPGPEELLVSSDAHIRALQLALKEVREDRAFKGQKIALLERHLTHSMAGEPPRDLLEICVKNKELEVRLENAVKERDLLIAEKRTLDNQLAVLSEIRDSLLAAQKENEQNHAALVQDCRDTQRANQLEVGQKLTELLQERDALKASHLEDGRKLAELAGERDALKASHLEDGRKLAEAIQERDIMLASLGDHERKTTSTEKTAELLQRDIETLHAEEREVRSQLDGEREKNALLEQNVKQQQEQLAARETELGIAYREIQSLFGWVEDLFRLFEEWDAHWWWKLGVRLRRVPGMLRAMHSRPQFTFDRAIRIRDAYEAHRPSIVTRVTEPAPLAKQSSPGVEPSPALEAEVEPTPVPGEGQVPVSPVLKEHPSLSSTEEEAYRRASAEDVEISKDLASSLAASSQADLVSIIVPTHNRDHTLNYCIDSILGQTYKNLEVFVIDDESTDGTRAMIKDYQSRDPRVNYIYKPKTNVSDTRNAGLKLCKGKYIAFLDSDSVWDRKFLAVMHHRLSTHAGDEKLAYCDVHFTSNDAPREIHSRSWSGPAMRSKPFIDLCCIIVDGDALRKSGFFDRQMTKWVDYELLLRFNSNFGDFLHVPVPLLHYFRLKDGLTLAPESQVPMRQNMGIVRQTKLNGLKLAYVLNDFPALSQTFVINEIAHLRRLGTDIVVFYKLEPDRRAEIPSDLSVTRFETVDELVNLLQVHKRNYMHTHFAYPLPPLFMLPAAERTNIPFTVMPHAVDIFLEINVKRNQLAMVANAPLCRGLFAEGSYHREYYKELGVPARKIRIVRPYCDQAEVFNPDLKPTPRMKNLITISRFQEKKGLSHLIEAFKKISGRKLRLDIYGYGPLEEELKKLAQRDGRIEIKPELATIEEVRRVLTEGDLFILPCVQAENGDKDGLPTILRQAMAAGTPVLTAPISSIPDLVVHDRTGFLVDPMSSKNLAREMKKVLALSEESRTKIRKSAQNAVMRSFNKELTIEGIRDTWSGG